MPPSEQRKAQIEKLLREAYQLKEETERVRLAPHSPAEDFRLKLELEQIDKQIAALEAEYNQLPSVPEADEEDSQFRAYFAALEKRFAIYDDPSKMIALRMQPGTLSPVERPAEGDWADDFEELSRFYLQPRFARPPAPDQRQPIIENVAAYLKAKKKVVLLGEPGAGKSTTLRLLARAVQRRFYSPHRNEPPTLPLYAALNLWSNRQSSLLEFLQSQISGMASFVGEEGDKAKLAELARRLPELIKAGRVVVLLDGLNELPGLQRDPLKGGAIDDERARMIERMAHEPLWEQTLCLLSCRIKDFGGDPVRWHDLHLQPLTRPQVEALALAHYQDRDLTNQLIADLYNDSYRNRKKLQELCSQPFYLVRLLRYYQEQGKLADNPVQLIKASVEAVLAREVTERKTMTQAEADELQTRLGYLAFNMTDARKVAGVNKVRAAAWLFHIWDEVANEKQEASRNEKKQAEKLIKQAEDANLVSDSGETVQFYHQLLQEYFTAAYLYRQPLTSYLLGWAANSPFDEVWPLWAGLNDKLVVAVVAFLKAANWLVRRDAASALGKIGNDRAVEPLIAALKDKDGYVRLLAVSALGQLGDSRAVKPLIAALKDADSDVREMAAIALGQFGEPAVLPLIAALKDENWQVRREAAEALVKIGEPAVLPLIAALKDEHWRVRRDAAIALGRIGDSRAVEPLIATLKDEASFVPSSASDALGKIGEPAVLPLIAALQDTTSLVRSRAAEILGWIGDSRAFPELGRLAREDEVILWKNGPKVKDVAARAIEKIKRKQAERGGG